MFLCKNRKNSLAAGGFAPTPAIVTPPLPNPGCATASRAPPPPKISVYATEPELSRFIVNTRTTFYQIVRSPLSSYGVPHLAHVPCVVHSCSKVILPLLHIYLGVMKQYVKVSGMLSNNKQGACFLYVTKFFFN